MQLASTPMLLSWSRQATAVFCSANTLTVSQPSTRGSPTDTAFSLATRPNRKRGRGTGQAYAPSGRPIDGGQPTEGVRSGSRRRVNVAPLPTRGSAGHAGRAANL
jgi:hypothetical protein